MSKNRSTWKYPKQLVVTVSTEVDETVARIADEQGLRKTEVVRVLLHDALRRAGYHVATKDKREPRLADLRADVSGEVTA